MKRYLILLFILVQLIVKGQSAPTLSINTGDRTDAIHHDSANFWTTSSVLIGANTQITRKYNFNGTFLQGTYSIPADSILAIKDDGNKIFICTPTYIRAITFGPTTVIWTCFSNTLTSSSPLGSATKRFLNMDLRNDTIFALYSDNYIKPVLISASAGTAHIYAANYASKYIVHNSTTCKKEAKIKVYGNKIYVYGNIQDNLNTSGARLFSFDIPNGNFNDTYPLFFGYTGNNLGFVNDIEFYNTKIFVGGCFKYVYTAFSNTRKSLAVFDLGFNLLSDTLSYSVFNITTELQGIQQLELYGNMILAKGVYHSVNNTIVSQSVAPQINLSGFNMNTRSVVFNIQYPNPICDKQLLEVDNFFLWSARWPDFSAASNQIIHLPPKTYGHHILYPGGNSLSTNSIITICVPDNGSITFTAPIQYHCQAANTSDLIPNAWSYSGSGATITPSPFGQTAQLFLSATATSGTLSVTGVNSLGNQSETMKLYINILPKPTITTSFLQTDTVSCKKPKIPFTVSVTPITIFTPTWTCPDLSYKYNFTDSTKFKMGGYYKTLVMGMNGCLVKDSIFAKVDTLKPNVALPVSQVYIKCDPDSSLLQGSSSTTNTTIWWRKSSAPTQYFQPYYTKTFGYYNMIVMNSQNGCKDSLSYQVMDNTMLPNSFLSSHTYINPVTPIDTITCIQPSVNIIAASDTSGTSIEWRNLNSSTFTVNPMSVTQQGNFKLYVTRSDNGCVDSSKIVFVSQNNSLPGVSILNENHELNCSYYSVDLTGITTNSNATLHWQTPSSFTITNPTNVSVPGNYILHTKDTLNGCEKLDTVSVNTTNQLVVNAGNNFKACKNSLLTLSASTIGTLTSVSYSWNTGSTGQTITTSASVTTDYLVFASGPNGCNGSDTVKVIVPANIIDSLATFQNCDNTPYGTITFYAQGGTPPYQYSINDGASFTSSNTFTQIPFGTYQIVTKDSLGCSKNNNIVLNGNSNLPVPKFIASTFNFSKDTIVLVDLSNPRPDSVDWILPNGMEKIGGNMFNPVIAVTDTGNYTVTMRSFYGSCILQTTKTLRFSQTDSTFANISNNNGIKSLNIYPNPNSGVFSVDIEFYKKQNFSIQLWDNLAHQQFTHVVHESDSILLPVNVSQLNNGSYVLRIVGEYDSRNQILLINK